jgi:hypothetical protein
VLVNKPCNPPPLTREGGKKLIGGVLNFIINILLFPFSPSFQADYPSKYL